MQYSGIAARLLVSFQTAATSDSRALGSSSLGEGICCLWATAFIRRDMLSPFPGTSLGKFPCVLPTSLGPTEAWSCLAKVNGSGQAQLNGPPSGVPRCFFLEGPVSSLPEALCCASVFPRVGKANAGPLWWCFTVLCAGPRITSHIGWAFTKADFLLWAVSMLVPERHQLWSGGQGSALKDYCIKYKRCSYSIEQEGV